MRKLFLSLVFLSALLSIHANPGIKGIVIDQTTRKALDYAHVVLYDGDHIVEEAMTEANGSFLIQPVKPGTYSIRIHFLGYDVYMGEEFILTEQIKDLGIIPMQMLEVGLQEVEVVANKKQVIYKLDKKIIEASSNLLSSGGTAVDILENTPSIRVNAEGEVTFRGSSGFTVYVDGKPSIFTGTQALEQIPSGQIQNIEIITTPSAQHDTGGDVGIINVITKKNFGEGLSGVINLSGNTVWSRTLDFLLTGQNKAGYQYFSYSEDGDYSMQFWNPDTKEFFWRDDIYNTFYFQQGINSLYAIVGDSYRSFDFQVGLRGEHTHQVLRSSKDWANRLQRRFELFPSAHIGYNLTQNQKLLFAYSRRTTRPELYFMEPYITYKDYYTAEIGNPDIRPEYIHSFELNYSLTSGDNALSASLFHRTRKDKIERLRVPYQAGVTLDSMANVGHDYSTGIELSGSLQATSWWNTQINGSLYHYRVENEYKTDGKNETSTNYEIAWNNAFTTGKYTRIQLDGNFVGPSVTTQGRTQSFWFVNLAIRQQFFKRKLTATLSFRDVFNTARYVNTITSSNLISKTRIRPDYPLIGLTLSYTFNQFKLKNGLSNNSKDLFEGTNH